MLVTAPVLVETERLLVRPIGESYLPELLRVNSSEEVTALLPYAAWKSMSDAQAWLSRMRNFEATGHASQLVVLLRGSDREPVKTPSQAIGTCLLFRFDQGSARAELGYVLGRDHWGQGLMFEALAGLLDNAFGPMALRRIEAEVDVRNQRSARLMGRLGFVREGLLRQRWVSKGQIRDVEIYGLLSHEWLSHRPKTVDRTLDAHSS